MYVGKGLVCIHRTAYMNTEYLYYNITHSNLLSTPTMIIEAHPHPLVFALNCGVRNYLWGKVGGDSKVAQLKASSASSTGGGSEFNVVQDSRYAEVGTGVCVFCNCASKLHNLAMYCII